MDQASRPLIQNDEISTREIILAVQDWLKYLIGKWKIIILFGMLGAALGFAYAFNKKFDYIADLSFVLEESKSNPLGAYSGIASQFGIDLSGSTGSGVFAGENIIEFLKSRLMIEKTLLSAITINDKKISLADFYIQINNMNLNWKNKPELANISFPYNQVRNTFTIKQDSILQIMYNTILLKNLTVSKPDKKLSFILVSLRSKDPLFSKYFAERLVMEATDFYVQTKIKRSKTNVDKLQEKADSIEKLLNQKTYSTAASRDLNLNPARNVARVGSELAARDQMVLQTMYAEIVKNLELSRMAMSQETPIIQIVDSPLLPLRKERFGKLKGLIIGGILGGFLIISWLIIRRMYKRIITEQ